MRNEPHQSPKSLPNIALHRTRARKLVCGFGFRGGRGAGELWRSARLRRAESLALTSSSTLPRRARGSAPRLGVRIRYSPDIDMKPTVKLRLGDMFDGPADLIVLPCSTAGTITGFVARRLVQHSIPHPKTGMKLGEVEILPFEGGEDIAQFVAFAASVHRNSSSVKELQTIGQALGRFTAENSSVKYVAAPLLGAGAGGIQSELVSAALREGFARHSSCRCRPRHSRPAAMDVQRACHGPKGRSGVRRSIQAEGRWSLGWGWLGDHDHSGRRLVPLAGQHEVPSRGPRPRN